MKMNSKTVLLNSLGDMDIQRKWVIFRFFWIRLWENEISARKYVAGWRHSDGAPQLPEGCPRYRIPIPYAI